MDSECNICVNFSKIFPGRPWTPYCRKGASPPASIQLRVKILPHHVYRSFEDKNHTKNLGRKINTQSTKKWTQNAPFTSIFLKISRGRPPNPLLQEGDIHSRIYTAKGKNSPESRISERSFEDKNYTKKFGWEINTQSAKIDSECTICIHFSKKISRGRPPGPPPAGGGIPLPHPPPAALRADLDTPPGSGPSGSATGVCR